MEAPKIERLSQGGRSLCMATESVDGQLSGCGSSILKRETMRPSSRVPLMVLCENHRARMVKHHCCPGCGHFCTAGTFLECHPDVRIGHRFHRGCVSQLNGMIFCPHCGEDASEAQEVTLPRTDGPPGPAAAPPEPRRRTPATRADAPTPSARMRGQGEGRPPPLDPRAEPIDSSGGPTLVLPSGGALSARGLAPGPARDLLEKALVVQESERRKKLRFHPRQLYLSVKQGELQKVVLMLLDNLDPNFQSDAQSKRTPLHAAAQKGYLEICHLLLQAGANINATDKLRRTPLMEAVANNHVEAARYMLRRGGCVYSKEEDGSTCLHHAAKNGNLEMVELLLSTGEVDVNAQDNGGWTPIIWAAEHKHIDVIRRLLTRGADVTLTDNEENICLHWASFTGSAEIAQVLLDARCDLHAVNFHGDTPLHIAACPSRSLQPPPSTAMAEGQKRGGFKKFKFFKFKGFESLSSIPRSFTLRRVSVVPSSPESLGMCLPPPQGFLEEAFDSTQDDLNTMPKGPGPYARSSDMYSHMGTMPRLSFGKVGKSLGKARGTQSCREKGSSRDKIPSTAPLPVPKALKMPGTLNLGKDPSSASGKAEQEKEKALPSGSPGAEKARMDQEIPGNSPSPGMEAPSPSLAPSPSAASGAETTDGDFQEKGQERPSESSPDSHHDGLESSSEYVKFSKEKYILDSSPEKLHKELEEELKLSSTDLRSHAWYHGRIPREVSESLVQRNGDFLIRDSLTSVGDYVLTCRWRNEPLHFKINKVTVKSSDGRTRVQYLFEQESFDNVPALVRFYVGNRKAISEQSGAIVYCPINRTFPLRYLEASYGLANGKHGGSHSPASQKGGHIKRRSITMTDGLTADKITRAEGCSTSVSLPHHRDIIRNCAVSVDQIQDLHSPMSPISENPTSPAYSTVTRLKPHACQAAGIAPASPVIRRSSEPQLCPGSSNKPLPDPAHSTHSTPCHGYARASPSPSVNSYSDPDTGHYCQLHPTSPSSRERPAHDTKQLPAKSYVERLKVEEGQRGTVENGSGEAEGGQRLKGERDFVGFVPPTVETCSSFNPAAFQSLLIPLENKPLEMAVLKKVKELLADADAKTLAKHITKVDCVVARILGVSAEMQRLMGVSSGMELLTLPHGHQLRLDLLERFHTMSIMIAVDILGCTGSTEERAALLHKTIQLAAELKSTMGNMFSFAAVMNALEMAQIARLEQTWMVLRQRHTEGAILYEKKLKPFLKSLNEGKEGPPLTNTTFPHVMPLVTLLERDDALVDSPEPWEATDNGVEVVMAHLEAARMVAHHGGLYHTNAEVKLQGFQGRAELLEIFSTEFQLRLLWGSRGAESSQAERYEKFDKVLTALSHKLEPAVRFSEL